MGSKKFSGSKKFWGPKNYKVQIILGLKKFTLIKFGSTIIFCPKKILGKKKIWVEKYFWSKKIVGPKKIESEKYFESKIFGPPPLPSHQPRVKQGGLDRERGGWDGGSLPWL